MLKFFPQKTLILLMAAIVLLFIACANNNKKYADGSGKMRKIIKKHLKIITQPWQLTRPLRRLTMEGHYPGIN
jgi:hypothetical protein